MWFSFTFYLNKKKEKHINKKTNFIQDEYITKENKRKEGYNTIQPQISVKACSSQDK